VTLTHWRDLAVILLVLEAFILALVPGAILFFTIRGVGWLRKQLLAAAPVAQGYARKAAQMTTRVSDQVVQPIVSAHATSARLARLPSALMSSFSPSKR
jgi:hypothetical protein